MREGVRMAQDKTEQVKIAEYGNLAYKQTLTEYFESVQGMADANEVTITMTVDGKQIEFVGDKNFVGKKHLPEVLQSLGGADA